MNNFSQHLSQVRIFIPIFLVRNLRVRKENDLFKIRAAQETLPPSKVAQNQKRLLSFLPLPSTPLPPPSQENCRVPPLEQTITLRSPSQIP